MTPRLPIVLLAVSLLGLARGALAAEDCDRSESRHTPSPDGRWIASVQEEVCAAGKTAAAGITVVLSPANDESQAHRVFVMAVPRSRDDWPRVRWQGGNALELWVANLAEVTPPEPEYAGIRIQLKYCGDNPQDRARVAEYKAAVKEWQRVVAAWVAKRKQDPDAAGPRPPRPEEPSVAPGKCTD